jgi:phosphatidate cytidylyltransferase
MFLRKKVGIKKKPAKQETSDVGYISTDEPNYTSDLTEDEGKEPPKLLANSPTKWRDFTIRTVVAILMLSLFVAIILSGHKWVAFFIVILQITVYKEVISIAYVPYKEKNLPLFRFMSW